MGRVDEVRQRAVGAVGTTLAVNAPRHTQVAMTGAACDTTWADDTLCLTRQAVLDTHARCPRTQRHARALLYTYYREPYDGRDRSLLDDLRCTGLAEERRGIGPLGGWALDRRGSRSGWIYFRRPSQSRTPGVLTPGRTLDKVYVSPRTKDLVDVLAVVGPVARSCGVTSWKVAASRRAALRPDKLVLYVGSERRMALISRLRPALDGATPHGVPLAIPVPGTSLLAWGVDPVDDTDAKSWRQAVAQVVSPAVLRSVVDPLDQARELLRSARLPASFAGSPGPDRRGWH